MQNIFFKFRKLFTELMVDCHVICIIIILFTGCNNPKISSNTISDNFKTDKGTFTDIRDGKIYHWVKIGNQIWMAENLNYASSSGSWAYDNDSANTLKFGRLYYWSAALTSCPAGWHLPSDAEWTDLTNFLGGMETSGNKLKIKDTSYWKKSNNTINNNESGFLALPGGGRYTTGSFGAAGEAAFFWTSTNCSGLTAYSRNLIYNSSATGRINSNKDYGFSCRCIKD